MHPSRRLAGALAVACLLTTACGARLTEAERSDALRAGPGVAAGGTTLDGAAAPGTELTGDGSAGTDTTAAGPAAGADGSAPGTAAGPDGATGPAGGGGTGGGGGGTGPAPATGPKTAAGTTDTRSAPSGGNGGATDTGVTANQIVISNTSDISGAVPGLFEDAQLAVKAYVAYFAASEGTIYGRKLTLLPLDSRLDTGANRSASIQACNDSLAGVGSTSAFDQGGADVIAKCGLPDLRAIATTDQIKAVPSVYPINVAGRGGERNLGVYGWAAKRFPDAVKKAAYLFSDGEVTRQTGAQDIEAAEKGLGYEFVYESGIAVQETNYSPFVQQMKAKGVRYVTFVGAYQQAANLAKTMQQQGFKPDVYAPTVTAYTPEYPKLAAAAAEGTYVVVTPSLVEEAQGNPELTLYAQWLNQVEPGATPTAIGQYAWAAAALFVEKAKKIGPKLTRKALLAEMPGVTAYTGNGLFPAMNIGGRILTDCVQVVQVKSGKFVRVEPSGVRKNRCGDGVFDTKSDRIVKRG